MALISWENILPSAALIQASLEAVLVQPEPCHLLPKTLDTLLCLEICVDIVAVPGWHPETSTAAIPLEKAYSTNLALILPDTWSL